MVKKKLFLIDGPNQLLPLQSYIYKITLFLFEVKELNKTNKLLHIYVTCNLIYKFLYNKNKLVLRGK